MGNYAGTLWEIVSAKSHREVKIYKGIDSPWPAIRVRLVLRRISFVDRKITVLPLVCKFVDIIIIHSGPKNFNKSRQKKPREIKYMNQFFFREIAFLAVFPS